MYVHLKDGKDKLPSQDYVRFVAQCLGPDDKVIRHDFAVHMRGARLCSLLEAVLDAVDVNLSSKFDAVNGWTPPVTLPQATKIGCELVFQYLELIQTRVPTLLSKPLRAPLEELVQPWEMSFLQERCLGGSSSGHDEDYKTSKCFRALAKKGPHSLDKILEVAMLSDFLVISSLRDLTCAFIASLGLSATSEKELLQLCGLDAPLTEEDLEPLYAQFGFLRAADES